MDREVLSIERHVARRAEKALRSVVINKCWMTLSLVDILVKGRNPVFDLHLLGLSVVLW